MRSSLLAHVAAAALITSATSFSVVAQAAPNAPPPVHHPATAAPASHVAAPPAAPQKSPGFFKSMWLRMKPGGKAAASAPRSTGPVAWKAAQKRLSAFEAGVDSGSSDRLSAALEDIGDLRIDFGSLDGVGAKEFNDVVERTEVRLVKLVTRAPEPSVRLAAMKAFAKFADGNTGGYQKGYLGKIAYEDISSVYHNAELGDDVRKVAFEELQKVNAWMKSPSLPTVFKSSAELRAERAAALRPKAADDLTSSAPRSAGPVAWNVAQKRLAAFEADVASGSPGRISGAIESVGELKLDLNSFGDAKPGDYNRALGSAVDKLNHLVVHGEDISTRSQAMYALAKFSRTNTQGYRKGYLVRAAIESISDIYDNPDVSDDLRKVAFGERQKFNESAKGGMFENMYSPVFKTAAQLRSERAASR